MTRSSEGWVHRSPRPLILWGAVALVCVSVAGLGVFLYRVGDAIADAFERSATTGAPVPDMSGGLPALFTAIGGLLAGLFPIFQALSARHRERMDQQARGGAPSVPFAPPPPSSPSSVAPSEPATPEGGLVNNNAL
jgi:hypothetical protein